MLLDFRQVQVQSGSSQQEAQDRNIELLKRTFKNKICLKSLIAKSNLKKLWKAKCQILVFYSAFSSNISKNSNIIFSPGMILSPFNENLFTQKSKWLQFLDNNYHKRRLEDHLYVTQGIMQPHWTEIAMAGVSEKATLKNWVSDDASIALVRWLKCKKGGQNGINIVIADFVQNHNFVDTVLSLNVVSNSSAISHTLHLVTSLVFIILLTQWKCKYIK